MSILSRLLDLLVFRPKGISGKAMPAGRQAAPETGPAVPGTESRIPPPPPEPSTGASQTAVEEVSSPIPPEEQPRS